MVICFETVILKTRILQELILNQSGWIIAKLQTIIFYKTNFKNASIFRTKFSGVFNNTVVNKMKIKHFEGNISNKMYLIWNGAYFNKGPFEKIDDSNNNIWNRRLTGFKELIQTEEKK